MRCLSQENSQPLSSEGIEGTLDVMMLSSEIVLWTFAQGRPLLIGAKGIQEAFINELKISRED